jgi:orotidine-5'-phosphate decarboxylase
LTEIIIALDFDDPENALDFAHKIKNDTRWVKLGLELFIRSGPEMVATLKQMGFRVFLDLKLLDIPNTVSGAVSSCLEIGADMLTLHTLGGEEMIKAAIDARNTAAPQTDSPILLGVTLLTSLGREDLPWPENRQTGQVVLDLAMKAHKWGLDGCVCSGLEAGSIRQQTDGDFCLVTPGIRTGPSQDDQKRVVTPESAQRAGANFLVVGRPVTKSPEPAKALRDIKDRLVQPARGWTRGPGRARIKSHNRKQQ